MCNVDENERLDSSTQLGFNVAEVVPAVGLWLRCFESKIQM